MFFWSIFKFIVPFLNHAGYTYWWAHWTFLIPVTVFWFLVSLFDLEFLLLYLNYWSVFYIIYFFIRMSVILTWISMTGISILLTDYSNICFISESSLMIAFSLQSLFSCLLTFLFLLKTGPTVSDTRKWGDMYCMRTNIKLAKS